MDPRLQYLLDIRSNYFKICYFLLVFFHTSHFVFLLAMTPVQYFFFNNVGKNEIGIYDNIRVGHGIYT
jgi:hypothetical protein